MQLKLPPLLHVKQVVSHYKHWKSKLL